MWMFDIDHITLKTHNVANVTMNEYSSDLHNLHEMSA